MSSGEVVIADRDYLIEAIVEPSARKVKGFNSMMPQISLSDDEVNKIVDYIQYLSE
jgi:cytochrome c oxidase subunit 2